MDGQASEFAYKRIVVLGAGVSGRAVALILQQRGAAVVLNDAKPAERIKDDLRELTDAGVVLALGYQDETLLDMADMLVVSPGIPIDIPLLAEARARKIAVLSEVEVAYRLCPALMLAVTGTNGKTTTTTLIGEMLRTTGRDIVVGGNIGLALSQETAKIGRDGVVVAEISSFQLEGTVAFRPHIAAILNVTPDHMDRHKTMDIYIEMKERLFANQSVDDYLILNYDDRLVRAMAAKAKARVVFFSRREELPEGVSVRDGVITIQWQGHSYPVCPTGALPIRGAHNVENALAACGAVFFAGVQPAAMARTLQSFGGVEHRLEAVAVVAGVAYYNDSKATNPESSIKALEAFDGQVILLAGGRDKHTDLTEFMNLVKQRVDQLILFGEASARFAAAAEDQGVEHIRSAASFSEAVALAHQLAKPPQVVLLSPACASYDLFSNYEERGRTFKELVHNLT